MKNTPKLFISLILIFLVVIFSVINAQQIDVNFLIKKVSLPLSIVLICSILIGALIVFIVLSSSLWQKNKEIKQLKNNLKETQSKHNNESDDEVIKLREELKEKELELSDLRHEKVNQLISGNEEETIG